MDLDFEAASKILYVVDKKLIAERIEEYVKNNLERLVKAQEEILGIKHYNIPEVRIFSEEMFQGGFGSYLNGVIYVPPRRDIHLDRYEESLFFIQNGGMHIDDILNHELGHHYTHGIIRKDKKLKIMRRILDEDLIDEFRRRYFPKASVDEILTTIDKFKIADKLVEEGIAEYFKHRMGKKDAINTVLTPLPKIDEDFDSLNEDKEKEHVYFYITGYHFVKPILEVDVPLGVGYLLKNLPWNYLYNLEEYQQKAIREVRRQKNPSRRKK